MITTPGNQKRRCKYRHEIPPGSFTCSYRHPVELPDGERIVYLDIETSNLDANFGLIYSWSCKPQGQAKVYHDIIADRSLDEERRILQSLLERMSQFTTVCGYYSTRFDIPFLRTRCMFHNLDFPPYGTIKHLDLYYHVRSKMKLHSNRLQVAADFLGIPGKTPLRGEVWLAASLGSKEAMAYILEHNIEDVKVLEQVHARLEPFYKAIKRSI